MIEQSEYYVVKKKAIPEVLLKVVEAKRMLVSGKATSVADAAVMVGISRSSFYKYKDDILPFYDNAHGRTFTLSFQMDDEPGVLSEVLQIIAKTGGNILTIHQSIPINGIASLSISIQVLKEQKQLSSMVQRLEEHDFVHTVQILGKE
ncbi:MAG: ACT domain-containing protein [Lachnospiraceae bacterium]